MASSYDITIDLRAKVDEVRQAADDVRKMVEAANGGNSAIARLNEAIGSADPGALRNVASSLTTLIASEEQAGRSAEALKARLAEVQSALKPESIGSAITDQLNHFSATLGENLLGGLTQGIGIGIAEKLTEALGEIPKLFTEAISKGVEFDREMESLGVSLAASMRQAQPEKYLDFAGARAAATQAIDQIQQKANALGLDFKAIGETLSVTFKTLADSGIRDLNQQIEVTTLLMQAASAKNVNGQQAIKDITDVLLGKGERVNLGREIGITNEDVKRAQQEGQLYSVIVDKLGAFKEAGEAAANTFNGLYQSVQGLLAQLEGSAALPVFDTLKAALKDIKDNLDSIQARGVALGTADFLGDLIHGSEAALPALKATLAAIVDQNTALSLLKLTAEGYYDQGKLSAYQQANDRILASIRDQVLAAEDDAQKAEARQKLDAAILTTQKEIETSQGVQKAAAENLLDALEQLRGSFGIVAGSARDTATATEGVAGGLAKSNDELDKMLAKLPAIVAQLNAAAQAAQMAENLANAIGPAAKLGVYQGEQARLLSEINKASTDAGGFGGINSSLGARGEAQRMSDNKVPQTAAQVEAYQKLGQLTEQLIANEKGISAEQRNQTAETEKLNAEELKRRELHQMSLATSKEELQADEQKAKVAALYRTMMQAHPEGDAKETHAAAEQQIADETRLAALNKQFNAEDKAAKKEGAQAAREQHQEELAADKDRKTALEEIKDRLQEIQKNPFIPESQKEPAEKKLLEDELKLLNANIAARQKLIDLYGNDPAKAGEVANLKRENVGDEHQAAGASQQLEGMTFGGQITKQINDVQKQWGTLQQSFARGAVQIANELTEGIGNALTGLITGTKSWGQAFTQIGDEIIGTIIKIVVQHTIGQALMYAINMAFGSASTSAAQAQGDELLASYSPAAIAASIASDGVAAGVGLAAYAGAIAAGTSGSELAGAFAEGGLIPGRPSSVDNRLAHVATGEYISQALSVQHYGPALYHALNQRLIPREAFSGMGFLSALGNMQVARTGFASGGLVGGGDGYTPIFATSSPKVSVGGHQVTLIQTRDRNEMLQAMASSAGRKIVLGHVTGNRTKVGIRS